MEKYINESMKQVCADIEAQQSWEDEKFMQELDARLSTDELEEVEDSAYSHEYDALLLRLFQEE